MHWKRDQSKIYVVILQYLTFELVLGQAHGSNRSYSFVSNELPPCLLFLSLFSQGPYNYMT